MAMDSLWLTQENLIDAMDAVRDDIGVDSCQGWIQHAKASLPFYHTRENIACDVV